MAFTLNHFIVLILVQTSYEVAPPRHHIRPHFPPQPTYHDVFPQSFSFGVAEGAYDHEGAWKQDRKGESIWDHFTHNYPERILDGTNADWSADAYNHLEEDVEILNNLTVRHFRFTLSWARIIPLGYGEVNNRGIHHYQRLLKLLKENRIEPIVVLYNGDLPQALEDKGGFLSDQFVSWFTEYARIVFECFGPSVKYWITFNDPTTQCKEGYGDGTFPPGVTDNPGVNEYICGHNLLKAHASVYRLYDECHRPTQKGKISISLLGRWYEPATNCITDTEAAERRLQFEVGWFAHPIYFGDYPQAMIDRIGQLSELQGLSESRLPRFSRKEIKWIKDTHDYFALNYFLTFSVEAIQDDGCLPPSFDSDTGANILGRVEGEYTYGIRKMIVWIKNQYINPSIFIVGNGFVTSNFTLEDYDRIEFIKNTLTQIRAAVTDDDARVYGYTYSTYIDGFVRRWGYTHKLGLYDVTDNPSKTRTARRSAEYYQHVCKYGCIDDPCPPRHRYEYEV